MNLAKTPEGAAQMQEYHRQLFANSSNSLRQEIRRITGMDVREATAEIEPKSGAVVQAFTTGNVVQVFQLAGSAPTEAWRANAPGDLEVKAPTPAAAAHDHRQVCGPAQQDQTRGFQKVGNLGIKGAKS
jgi:hypothetical protein